MNDRKVLTVAGITLLSIWMLGMAWEFGLEVALDPFFGTHHDLDPGGRLKHVITITFLAGLAIITPTMLLLKFVAQNTITEQALNESEERYRNLVEMSPNAIIVIQGGRIVYANSSADRLMRADEKGKIIGRPPQTLIHANSANYLHRFETEIWENEILPLTEVELVRLDGSLMTAEVVSAVTTFAARPAIQAIIFDISRRKEQERRLKGELHFRQTLMENLPYPVFYKNRQGVYTGCNKAFLQYLGKTSEEVVGKTVYEVAPGDLATMYHQADIDLIETRGNQIYESQVIYADGSRHDVIFNKAAFHDHRGKIAGLVGTIVDITERKTGERALVRANRALKALSLCNQALVHEYDADQMLNEVCRIITEEAGYRMSWIGMFTQDEQPRVTPTAMAGHIDGYLDNINIALDGSKASKGPIGQAVKSRKPVLARDLSTDPTFAHWRDAALARGYASASVYPLFAENDRVLGCLMVYAEDTGAFDEDEVQLLTDLANNISFGLRAIKLENERKITEHELNKLSSAIAQSPAMVVITDADWIVEYVNLKFTEVRGIKPYDIVGRNAAELRAGWTASSSNEDILHALETTGEWRGEFWTDDPAMNHNFLQVSIADVRDNNNNITNYLTTLEDITDRRAAEVELQKAKEAAETANRTKSQFMANISHELRTPLNAVIGFSDILIQETYGPLKQEGYLDSAQIINEAGRQLLTLINDLIDISRVDIGQLTLREINIDPGRVVRSCGRLVQDKANKAEVSLNVDIPDDLPALFIDEQRLKQIILNMLSNAIKFTPANGTIDMSVALNSSDQFVFAIADTGIGIAKKDMERVMTIFGQVDESLSRNYDGVGLGVPLSRELTEAHGGTFVLESDVGKGTTAVITFPASRTIRFSDSE